MLQLTYQAVSIMTENFTKTKDEAASIARTWRAQRRVSLQRWPQTWTELHEPSLVLVSTKDSTDQVPDTQQEALDNGVRCHPPSRRCLPQPLLCQGSLSRAEQPVAHGGLAAKQNWLDLEQKRNPYQKTSLVKIFTSVGNQPTELDSWGWFSQ